MKNITTALFALGLVATSATQAHAADTELTLTVTSIENHTGTLMVAVFDSAEAWSGGSPVAGARIDVSSETATAAIGTLPAGRYAIRMYHDVNGNGEMDTNLMGIPSEPFAFSNNAQGRFGPASWEDSVFEVAGQNLTHSVRLD